LEGALISSSGDFMQNVAQSWLVWELTRSPVALGVIAFCDTLPRLLVGAVGGAIADRFDRRRVLMITQSLAMIQAVIYWLAVEFKVILFWQIAVLAFFLGTVNTINQTARQSLVNSLVPNDELLNAIGLQSSVFNFSKIVGPSAGGIIIALVGIAGCFLINALSFVALLFNLYLMELPPREERLDHKRTMSRKASIICAATGGFYISSLFPMWWLLSQPRTTASFRCLPPTFCVSVLRDSAY
jgi:MFS family permease